jgi:aminoglycoside 3-N-acetyltransferase
LQETTSWLTRKQLAEDLRQLGVAAGQLLMVHSSLRALGRVMGGPNTVLTALQDALTPSGTLLMYIGWEHAPSDIFEEAAEVQALFYAHCPPYDPQTARAVRDHGVLVECFRTWPGVLRSAHPDCSFGAWGAYAAWIVADHPFNYGYGPGSPLHKLCEADGYVLLLGAPLDTLTVLHYAEDRARLPNKRIKRYRCPILHNGETLWVDLEEFETGDPVIDADYAFETIGQDYVASGKGRVGTVGSATSYLLPAADLVQFGIEWLESRFGQD